VKRFSILAVAGTPMFSVTKKFVINKLKTKNMSKVEDNMNWGDFSALLSIFLIVFIVIYADGQYDIWDALLGTMTLVSLRHLGKQIKEKKIWVHIERVAFAISFMIILSFSDSLVSLLIGKNFIISPIRDNYGIAFSKLENIFDFDFILALSIYLIALFISKFKKEVP